MNNITKTAVTTNFGNFATKEHVRRMKKKLKRFKTKPACLKTRDYTMQVDNSKRQ